MLPLKLGPRLADIVLRDKYRTEARLLPIDFSKVGNQIFAEESYALELIVENSYTLTV